MEMSKQTTREYTLRMRERHMAMRTRKAKGRVIDEFCATTGLERKHAGKTLRSVREPLRASGRKPVYAEARKALARIWIMFDQPCSKLFHPVMAQYVSSYELHEIPLEARVRDLLLRMSASTIDRLLLGNRVRTSLWRGRGSPAAAMKREIPVRCERWEGRGPGWCEADLVAHCGGSMEGSFAYSLTFTDTDTQWTEMRSVWNRGGHATSLRFAEIEAALPFPLAGVNTDNGPEFLNWHVIRHFRDRAAGVPQSRSRPYHKNDNARVEQKNGSLVRSLLGYDRFGDAALLDMHNEILSLHSCWTNLFRPCMKLTSKIREGHKYKKTYDRPATPAQRVLSSPGTTAETRSRITAMAASYDCYGLKRDIADKLAVFFGLLGLIESRPAPAATGPSALRAVPSGTGPRPATAGRGTGHHPQARKPLNKTATKAAKQKLVSVS